MTLARGIKDKFEPELDPLQLNSQYHVGTEHVEDELDTVDLLTVEPGSDKN